MPGMKKMILLPFLVGLCLLLTGCDSLPENPPATVESVDLSRYAGLWHEIARLPVVFQKDNERATAEYSLTDEGTVALVNTAIAPDGRTRSVTGTAVPVEASHNARLKVSIDNFFARLFGSPPEFGNYWILKLDPAYQVALVGSPDRKTLWLLAREPRIDPAVLEAYIRHVEQAGYPTGRLLRFNEDPL